MDRKLKERLVGAAVLIALGVWLIPWVLDGPTPARDADDELATLELPVPVTGQAEPLRRETIELEAPRPRAAAEPEARTPARREQTPATAATPTPEPATTPPKSEPKAAPATSAATQAARAGAATPPRTPASTASSEAAWMVQLGSFGDEANARRQADRIKTFGHEARIYPFTAGGRTMYRVRVGSYPTRNQAEATASALSAHGFPAQIVAPE